MMTLLEQIDSINQDIYEGPTLGGYQVDLIVKLQYDQPYFCIILTESTGKFIKEVYGMELGRDVREIDEVYGLADDINNAISGFSQE